MICFAAILLFLSLASSAGVSPIALLFGRFTIALSGLNRQLPSLDEATVIGVLQAGDPVRLTGWVAQGDGVTWVKAIAAAQYPNQVGDQRPL
ncbi:hypothetical protein H6F67_21235 [Microcoleus sp. FACHB-1515]|uniref:hypothetical protein n=1 Tax=Cyanophyceae TaxID=3028117 RepID=UPI001686F759|nr:hypothetical protein [Microcoleus sp. FACHB-1515]MBD2092377.1 hypothetical protein [Microcoleus sp. FACHB-1515]